MTGGEEDELNVEEDLRGRVCVFWENILPHFLSGGQRAQPRDGRIEDRGCREVKNRARMYFPGYRPIHRLK